MVFICRCAWVGVVYIFVGVLFGPALVGDKLGDNRVLYRAQCTKAVALSPVPIQAKMEIRTI